MKNVGKVFSSAVAEHGRGNVARAKLLYLQVLKAQPRHSEALLRLGATCLNEGKPADALLWLNRCVAAAPNMAAAYSNLGVALRRLGRMDEAMAALTKAVEIDPNDPSFRVNLGNALQAAGCLAEALEHHGAATNLAPDNGSGWSQLGAVLMAEGRADEAEAALRRAITLNGGDLTSAANLAIILAGKGKAEDAVAIARQVVALAPDNPFACKAMGVALSDLDTEESARWLRRSLEGNPRQADAWNALGNRELATGHIEESLACFDKALEVNPADRNARFNKGRVGLLAGRWLEAWPDYEQRWGTAMTAIEVARLPRWDGSSFAGRTLLIYCEQGLGDTLQFLRYLPLVKALGGRVILGVQKEVHRLVEGLPELDQVVPYGEPLPPFDLQCALLSLPGMFRTTPQNVPPIPPLAGPSPQLRERWAAEIPSDGRLKVGLVWSGNPNFKDDRERSPGFGVVAPLLELPGIVFVSLQRGAGLNGITLPDNVISLGDKVEDFADTAAVMSNLDLMISSCTSPLHMSATLGVPTWGLLPFVPDWRWMMQGETSPWYPSLRLFRQPARGAWGPVTEKLVAEMRSKLTSSSPSP